MEKIKLYMVLDKFGHPLKMDLLIDNKLEFPIVDYKKDINEDEIIVLFDKEYTLELDKHISGGSSDIFYYNLLEIEKTKRHNLTYYLNAL